MEAALQNYIIHYAYLAIFSLVFLQELGVPNPVPNEFILLYSGFLTYSGRLSFVLTIFTVVAADLIGTSILYAVFYLFGKEALEHKPKWFPVSKERIEKLSNLISGKGFWGIYLGRLLPYVRGYTSVASGLLEIKPFIYLSMVLLSALTWSGGYVIAGHLLGSGWQRAISKFHLAQDALLGLVVLLIVFFVLRLIYKRIKSYRD